MKIIVSCKEAFNKPHKDAVLKEVGKGHQEYFIETDNYELFSEIIERRKFEIIYDSCMLTLRLIFNDIGCPITSESSMTSASISEIPRTTPSKR